MAKATITVDKGSIDRVVTGLKQNIRGLRNADLHVGFTAPYAVYVHERLGLHHPIGQAKFLEEPARTYAAEILRIVAEVWQGGKVGSRDLVAAMTAGGEFLLMKAKELVPVATGFLRDSGYIKVIKKE